MIRSIREFARIKNACADVKTSDEMLANARKFATDEQYLRSGGPSFAEMCRAAFGFAEEDVTEIKPGQLNIKWKDDLDNVKYEQEYSKLSPVAYAKKIDLSEPIDVSYEHGKFWIEDGHHRYYAANVLGKTLKVKLEIKQRPLDTLAPTMGYDEYCRCVFKKSKETK